MLRTALALALVSGSLGACANDDVDPAGGEATVDQELTNPPFELRSTVFTGQDMQPINFAVGQTVVMNVAGNFTKEKWTFANLQLVNVLGLCLQPASTAHGAALVLQRCDDPFDITHPTLQAWNLRKRPNGLTRWVNLTTGDYIDGSGGFGSPMRQQPESGLPAQDFQRVF